MSIYPFYKILMEVPPDHNRPALNIQKQLWQWLILASSGIQQDSVDDQLLHIINIIKSNVIML
jgi:hypothetical protein